MKPSQIIDKIRSEISDYGSVATVFDLDSTLFCVSSRSEAILKDLANDPAFSSKFPEAARKLSTVVIPKTEYGIKETMIRIGMPPDPELIEFVRKHWREKFFGNAHMVHDLVYPGAVEFVHKLHEIGAQVHYLTGRDDRGQYDGTHLNFKNWAFPEIPLEQIMLMPSTYSLIEEFKEARLRALSEKFNRIWFFENEPVIIHHVRRQLPHVHIVFIDSTHSGKADPPTDLLTLRMDYRLD